MKTRIYNVSCTFTITRTNTIYSQEVVKGMTPLKLKGKRNQEPHSLHSTAKRASLLSTTHTRKKKQKSKQMYSLCKAFCTVMVLLYKESYRTDGALRAHIYYG
jgi:hypothetical protein